jgi:CRP/FNR family transcriptional regulator, cyclic AMP receptor protein
MTAAEASIPILAALSPRDREKILAYARRRTYATGETVVREGDSALNLFLIVSGHARVEVPDNREIPAMGPGDFFGEIGLIEQHARTATIVAADELTCILLPAWEFRSLLAEHPQMAVPMVHALIARLHGMSPHHHGD